MAEHMKISDRHDKKCPSIDQVVQSSYQDGGTLSCMQVREARPNLREEPGAQDHCRLVRTEFNTLELRARLALEGTNYF